MNAPFSQVDRLGRLNTVLGEDALALLRFDGSDHVNALFEYRVEALAAHGGIDFDALLGTHATVTIDGHHGARHFDGIVTQTRWAGVGENGHRYDVELRPWAWLAGRRRNQRIFHDKSVVQILRELFAEYAPLGDPALEFRLSEEYPPLEYTVQYRESDLDFACRQLERAGISFHFRHQPGSHTMVLTDDVLAHDTIGARPYRGYDGHHQAADQGEHFWEWAPERNLTTGAVRLTDYNFKTPATAMEVDRLGDARHAQGQIESFDWPGDYADQGHGKARAGLRLRQERGADQRSRAVGDCLGLGAGKLVGLTGDPVPGSGQTYLCLSANHHFVSEAYGSGGRGSDGYSYSGSYVLTPDTAPMAPPRRTAVPVVQGPQTAFVVGEGEIDCDEYGRILVRFHWDLEGALSMRCRVSQNWAGSGWGGMVIPRVGMEVVVEFLDGDPDRPLVTGCVFNGQNAAPYGLPADRTKAVWRSNTHQGQGFNEISFEDQAGRELVYLHAQRDHATDIGNDETHRIGHDRQKTVANDQSESVGRDKTISVGANHSESIAANKTLSVGGDHTATITGAATLSVGGAQTRSIAGDDSTTVSDGNQTVTVARGTREIRVLEAGQYTTVNNDIVTVSRAGGVSIKAATSVVLDAPTILLRADAQNFIMVTQGQVVIEGAETFINPRESAPDT